MRVKQMTIRVSEFSNFLQCFETLLTEVELAVGRGRGNFGTLVVSGIWVS